MPGHSSHPKTVIQPTTLYNKRQETSSRCVVSMIPYENPPVGTRTLSPAWMVGFNEAIVLLVTLSLKLASTYNNSSEN